jgi:hypothetical protein
MGFGVFDIIEGFSHGIDFVSMNTREREKERKRKLELEKRMCIFVVLT